jgi:hypothetical protein
MGNASLRRIFLTAIDRFRVALLVLLTCEAASFAQGFERTIQVKQAASQHADFDVALKTSLKSSSLTYSGKPFHALLEIGTPGSVYSGSVEVWWTNQQTYKLVIKSPEFSEAIIVHGDREQVKTDGGYYPRWLQNFVDALVDPLPMAANFRGRIVSIFSFGRDPEVRFASVSRDDRINGITDPMTVGSVSFAGPDMLLNSTTMFNSSMHFADWEGFEGKQIARTYETNILDHQKLAGRLTILEKLKKWDPSFFKIDAESPAGESISTAFIPTAQEEGLLEKAPQLEWPSVREGRTDGYMIVFVRTDKTGQVREAAEYSSHNPAVEKFGMEHALDYKFKPLIIDGKAVQFETPLVLHYTSRIENPIPILTVEQMKAQMADCDLSGVPKGPLPSGNILQLQLSIDEHGKYAGMTVRSRGNNEPWDAVCKAVVSCAYKLYYQNGHPTYYKGEVELSAK